MILRRTGREGKVRAAGRAGMRDALQNESSAERILYAGPTQTWKEGNSFREREVRWQQVRYDLEKEEGEKRKKKLLRLQPMQDGDRRARLFRHDAS